MKNTLPVNLVNPRNLWEEYSQTFNRIAVKMERCNIDISELHRLIELAIRIENEYECKQ